MIIPLTQGYVAHVDDEDYERVSAFKWCAQVERRRNGSIRNVYAKRRAGVNDTQLLHRFILQVVDPSIDVDHEDHDGLNCRKLNLRHCSRTQNLGNQRKNTSNTSGFKGVSWHKANKRWRAAICIKGKQRNLGCFLVKKDAAEAYRVAAIEHFGEFSYVGG